MRTPWDNGLLAARGGKQEAGDRAIVGLWWWLCVVCCVVIVVDRQIVVEGWVRLGRRKGGGSGRKERGRERAEASWAVGEQGEAGSPSRGESGVRHGAALPRTYQGSRAAAGRGSYCVLGGSWQIAAAWARWGPELLRGEHGGGEESAAQPGGNRDPPAQPLHHSATATGGRHADHGGLVEG